MEVSERRTWSVEELVTEGDVEKVRGRLEEARSKGGFETIDALLQDTLDKGANDLWPCYADVEVDVESVGRVQALAAAAMGESVYEEMETAAVRAGVEQLVREGPGPRVRALADKFEDMVWHYYAKNDVSCEEAAAARVLMVSHLLGRAGVPRATQYAALRAYEPPAKRGEAAKEVAVPDVLPDTADYPLNAPAFERLDPSKGFVEGNVVVVCGWLNRVRGNHTLQELEEAGLPDNIIAGYRKLGAK